MEELQNKILERNAIETAPFLSIHESNAALQNTVDALELRCEALQRECAEKQIELDDRQNYDNTTSKSQNKAATAALRNEARMRDKMEKLQEELNEKLRLHAEQTTKALETTKELSDTKDLNIKQEKQIEKLSQENDDGRKTIETLTNQLQESQSSVKLTELQCTGLKDTIRTLQEENDGLTKENQKLVSRIVTEKEKASGQINVLNETNEKLKAEVSMLRELIKQESKRKTKTSSGVGGGWFSKVVGGDTHNEQDEKAKVAKDDNKQSKWGSLGPVIPSMPKFTIQAHNAESTCVRYDDGGGEDLVATSGSDSIVKIWNTSSGRAVATLRGNHGHTIHSCDIGDNLVIGGGSDRCVRIWKLQTERMIHQLVGHSNKITCTRLFTGGKMAITGSEDRSLKLWDISRSTYRQTTTFRYSGVSQCIDISSDSNGIVSGHKDGNLMFWDVRSGERSADMQNIHEGGITSVQFHPTSSTQLLTVGRDSTLNIVDVRICKAIITMQDKGFYASFAHSAGCFSPDGKYAAAGSGTTGDIFIWRAVDGSLEKKVCGGHMVGVGGLAWRRGGGNSNSQQVASVDRKGVLVLWS